LILAFGVWLIATRSEAASLRGTVSLDDKPIADAVIYLESAYPRVSSLKSEPVVIEQHNLAFFPAVVPVVQGTTVKFINSDNVTHGIFSPTTGSEKLNLGTYNHGEARLLKLNTPGEVVLLCPIHLEMEARILVLKDPYFARSSADGRYAVTNVPPGAYLVRVWRKQGQTLDEPLELSLAGDLTLDLKLNR
jgi:plastocyanin